MGCDATANISSLLEKFASFKVKFWEIVEDQESKTFSTKELCMKINLKQLILWFVQLRGGPRANIRIDLYLQVAQITQ